MEYIFSIVLRGAVGSTAQSVTLYLSPRADTGLSEPDDFYSYNLSCTDNIEYGAYCSSVPLVLGPGSDYTFYFEAVLGDGTVVRYPSAPGTNLSGPYIKLVSGYAMIGIPRNITSGPSLTGTEAFNTAFSYRWVSTSLSDESINFGAYESIDSSGKGVSAGEGYFINTTDASIDNLIGFNSYLDNKVPDFTIVDLKPGWNMISNPYGGHVYLKDIIIERLKSDEVLWEQMTWKTASNRNYVINGLFSYDGTNWGKTYSFMSANGANEAMLAPWLGYWIYLKNNATEYKLVIGKPE